MSNEALLEFNWLRFIDEFCMPLKALRRGNLGLMHDK